MPNSSSSPLLSVIIPGYNEEEVLPFLREKLDHVLGRLSVRSEVVLIDDGSRDRSAEIMREFARQDSRYKALLLSRNYGHQMAITAGLDHAAGDVVVVLDADLQDPPELIPEMLAKWKEGYQVVYGQRTTRQGDSWAKKVTAGIFYRFIRRLSGVDIPRDAGDFRLMDRKVVDALKRMPEHHRFVRGMVAWAGFRQCPIFFERPPRKAGTTKYPWRKMFQFALDAIFAFSVIPLRISTGIGLLIMGFSMLEILWILYLRFILNITVKGYSSILIAILLLGGLNLLILGILGEYIGRIYIEAKNRPLYLVQEFVAHPSADQNS
ncbi:MAG: glycosyltransferase family 2 protein [Elusimicrobia bacterium]|nr:glycosyltransferase family 2 protein [Elusimicrobiota bacterium]